MYLVSDELSLQAITGYPEWQTKAASRKWNYRYTERLSTREYLFRNGLRLSHIYIKLKAKNKEIKPAKTRKERKVII